MFALEDNVSGIFNLNFNQVIMCIQLNLTDYFDHVGHHVLIF
jgi:hypothetical protein